ncbi:MAG TPA: succinate dehydrogenase/fumarate reductase iron-sulfur subunit [Anaerolineae bacterium]|nr:succinate dehydrogenase/fumarate reductase iron-sulfur subunit [Anaerolineae bacterium]
MTLEVALKVFRYKAGQPARYDTFRVRVPHTASVLDAIEAAWAQHDRSLTFRHACHHASCGSCAMRIDGREKLPCITPVRDVWRGRGDLRIEPLRNFPIVSDLVVDVSGFFQRMSTSGMVITRTAESYLPVAAGAADGRPRDARSVTLPEGVARVNRFENCIECGICISACPTMAASDKFMGPAALAGIYRARLEAPDEAESTRLLGFADGEHGVWRCHSGWECTEACPQGVDPAGAIMLLRRDLVKHRIRKLFGR